MKLKMLTVTHGGDLTIYWAVDELGRLWSCYQTSRMECTPWARELIPPLEVSEQA